MFSSDNYNTLHLEPILTQSLESHGLGTTKLPGCNFGETQHRDSSCQPRRHQNAPPHLARCRYRRLSRRIMGNSRPISPPQCSRTVKDSQTLHTLYMGPHHGSHRDSSVTGKCKFPPSQTSSKIKKLT
jgi:hypothetical protein